MSSAGPVTGTSIGGAFADFVPMQDSLANFVNQQPIWPSNVSGY
jgi:hypothetical protein